MSCPLCKSDSEKVIEKIFKKNLVNLYQKKYNIDVDKYFKTNAIDLKMCEVCRLFYFFPFSGGDENFYEHFQKYEWYYLEEKNEYNYATQFIKPTDKVLEIGSGKGVFVSKISSADYVGLEFSKTACDLAATNGVKVFNESIEDHVLSNRKKYDVVCCFQVLEHVNNINSFLQSAVDCLKIGGKLIVSVPSDESFFGNMVNAYLNLPPHHASRWSDYSLKKVTTIFNLNLEMCYHEKLDPIHRLFYARTLIENLLRKKMGMKFSLVDMSITHKLIKIVALIFAKFILNILLKNNDPIGHSVIVVYTKI